MFIENIILLPRGWLWNHISKQYSKTKITLVLYHDLIQHKTHSVTLQKHDVPYDLRRTPFKRLWVHNPMFCRPTSTVQCTVRRTQFSTQYEAHSVVLVYHDHLSCRRSALLPFAQAADASRGYRFARASSLANSSLAAVCVSLTAFQRRLGC